MAHPLFKLRFKETHKAFFLYSQSKTLFFPHVLTCLSFLISSDSFPFTKKLCKGDSDLKYLPEERAKLGIIPVFGLDNLTSYFPLTKSFENPGNNIVLSKKTFQK